MAKAKKAQAQKSPAKASGKTPASVAAPAVKTPKVEAPVQQAPVAETAKAVAPAAAATAPAAAATAPAAAAAKQPQALPLPGFSGASGNPYLPLMATVVEVIDETPAIKTFRLVLKDEEAMKNFRFEPGQVGQLSMFGVGESTFVINSPPTRMEYLQFSVMKAGENTSALHTLKAGDTVGVRAPLGNAFPYNDLKGKDIVFIGGGIGMAPLRTLLLFMLDNRKDYGKISLLYGARSPQDMAFSAELPEWLGRDDLETVLTIDREAEGWPHRVGLIPNVLLEMAPSPKNCVAITCGPPIMIKFTLQALEKLGFAEDQIMTTLEKRMKCGIGICGRCNIGDKYVCIDGPVFTMAQLKAMPNEL